jgi:hypothetical protein
MEVGEDAATIGARKVVSHGFAHRSVVLRGRTEFLMCPE